MVDMNAVIVINKADADFQGLKWVFKACSKEESRWALSDVFSIGKHVFGTDGHRLHALRLVKATVPKGAYKYACNPRQIILYPDAEAAKNIPDIKNVLPKRRPLLKTKIMTTPMAGASTTFTLLVRACAEDQTFNYKYIEEMTSDSVQGFFRYFGPGDPIWMKNGKKMGLLMPLRM